MESLCNRMKDVHITSLATLLLVSIPGYIVCKDYVAPAVLEKYNTLNTDFTAVNQEEDILEAKVKSENIRSGPAFLNSHVYHGRRTERVKSAYSSVCHSVNQNLDLGNKVFKVSINEDDRIILNVVRKLLIDELDKDGYSANVSVHKTESWNKIDTVTKQDSDNENQHYPFYFVVTIV